MGSEDEEQVLGSPLKFTDTLIKNPLRLTKSVAFSDQTNDKDNEKEADYLKPSSLFPGKPFEDIPGLNLRNNIVIMDSEIENTRKLIIEVLCIF
jgi:hypothetical protein